MINLHEQTQTNIAAANAKYQVVGSKGRKLITFEPGDMVWLHLRKDRFPTLRRSKLMPRAAGPFKVLTKINDNAYILDLPAEFGVSTSFNVADLKPYAGEDDELPSGRLQFKKGRMMRTSPTTRVHLHLHESKFMRHLQSDRLRGLVRET
jgi:hypothetical protein